MNNLILKKEFCQELEKFKIDRKSFDKVVSNETYWLRPKAIINGLS